MSQEAALENWNVHGKTQKRAIKSIKDLEAEKPFEIMKTVRKNTVYGEKIMIECKDFVVFLPDRYNNLSDEDVNLFNVGKYKFIKEFDGPDNYSLRFVKGE